MMRAIDDNNMVVRIIDGEAVCDAAVSVHRRDNRLLLHVDMVDGAITRCVGMLDNLLTRFAKLAFGAYASKSVAFRTNRAATARLAAKLGYTSLDGDGINWRKEVV